MSNQKYELMSFSWELHYLKIFTDNQKLFQILYWRHLVKHFENFYLEVTT